MLIFLIGMMGSGKTTVGKKLAEALQLAFYDTDIIIESLEEKTIAEIFNKHGEAYFRAQEKSLVMNWKLSHAVVATGGGLPCYSNLMDVLQEKGKTVYLQSSVDTLVERLNGDPSRPLIDQMSDKEKTLFLKNLYKERRPFYQRASIRIKNDGHIDEVCKRILSKLYQ